MLVKTRRDGGTISRKTPFIGYSAPSGARMTIRSAPPGLRSTSQTGLVKVFGPHHFASCFGSVHALKTSSRGALKTRVMVSSRSANGAVRAAVAIEESLFIFQRRRHGGVQRVASQRYENSGGLFAVDHPRRPEAVGEHAELLRPESFLQLHMYRSVLRHGLVNALRLARIVEPEIDVKALRRFGVIRRRIRCHQQLIAQFETGMDDLVLPLGGYLAFGRRAGMRHHRFDFAAERLFVKFERFFAVSFEEQIRVRLHHALL